MKIVAITIYFLLAIISINVYADKIVVAADIWCPVNCETGAPQEGFMVDIAKAAFAKSGHQLEYRVIPWNRALKLARDGKINGVIGAYLEDSPDFIFPKNELGLMAFQIFVKKQSQFIYTGFESLKSVSIGVVDQYSYTSQIDNYIKKANPLNGKVQVMYGKSPIYQNINKLMADRFDAMIATDSIFWHTANIMKLAEEFKSAGIVTKPRKLYIAFSPTLVSSTKYAKTLSDGVKELRKSGELNKILKKYNLKDWINNI